MLEELWRQYKYEKSNNAREKLVVRCLPLVKAMAQRLSIYTSPCCDVDDLVSCGIIGLLDALEKYDPSMYVSFRTYAKCRIRGAILDEIRKLRWAPRSIQEKIRDLRRVNEHLEQILSRTPNEEELSDALGMSLDQFRKMLVQIGPSAIFVSSSMPCNNDDEYSDESIQFESLVADPEAVNPDVQVISDETRNILAETIKSLPEKESIVISLYYYEEMTMKEIGEVLNLTESRVCQIHSKALLSLFQVLNTRKAFDRTDLCNASI
ncbi:MAG: sigma-70 family RNA polymerase sigma factor [bacterium]